MGNMEIDIMTRAVKHSSYSNTWTARTIGILLLIAGLQGCDDGSSEQGSTMAGIGTGSDFCSAVCQHFAQCNTRFDTQTCVSGCKNEISASERKQRDDYLNRARQCITSSDCAKVLDDDVTEDCFAESEVQLTPSATAKRFCDKAANSQCTRDTDKAECLSDVKTYNDQTLSDAEACLTKACSEIEGCMKAVFEL